METARGLRAVDHLCVGGIAAVYIVAIVCALLGGMPLAGGLVVVPALGFALLSWVRARIDAPRPYEVEAVNPLLDSATHGKSFPSRHVGSGALIGSALLFVYPVTGICVLLATAALALVRVRGRVHYVRDVIVGYLGGAAFGLVGMLVCTLAFG